MLNFTQDSWTNEQVAFDDSLGEDDDRTACCMPSELLEQCPFPACPGSDEEGEVKRRLEASRRPARWWLPTTAARVTAYDAAAEPGSQKVLQSVSTHEWYREYAVTHQRNNVCLYDETYNMWVKTACHGKRNLLVHQTFADAACSRLMTTAEHVLDQVIPGYGMCAQSTSGDGRTALTVCHNKDGVALPPYQLFSPPPAEAF